MKLTSIFAAASLLAASAMPSFAQTAPAAAQPAAPAATQPAANAFANVPAVQQVGTQLSAQGYSITNVVQGANGTYTITALSAAGVTRTITVNPATGAVIDSLNGSVAPGAGEGDMGNDRNERGNDTERGNNNDGGQGNEAGEGGSNG